MCCQNSSYICGNSTSTLYRCGCCVSRSGVCKQRLVEVAEARDSEEKEQLQEPLDQISLSSVDSVDVEPNGDYDTKCVAV